MKKKKERTVKIIKKTVKIKLHQNKNSNLHAYYSENPERRTEGEQIRWMIKGRTRMITG